MINDWLQMIATHFFNSYQHQQEIWFLPLDISTNQHDYDETLLLFNWINDNLKMNKKTFINCWLQTRIVKCVAQLASDKKMIKLIVTMDYD